MLDSFAQRLWYGRSPLALLLLPLSGLFIAASMLRRVLYRVGLLSVVWVGKPVIVVGNITVGGTGKTPLVIWLAQALRDKGYVPGIITRGYGGASDVWPCDVVRDSDPNQVGDEAVVLAERTGEIVVAGPDRASAAARAIERGATVVVADDGLQHYRLGRDFEIAVVDATRRFGNGYRLPAGPLRESPRRLATVEAVVRNTRDAQLIADHSIGHRLEVAMRGRFGLAQSLATGETRSLSEFAGKVVHAIAGVGNPEAFFHALRAHGLQVDAHAFADHAQITPGDLQFPDVAPILMTEKDAVKCRAIANERCWVVPLDVEIDAAERLLSAIARKLDSASQAAHSAHPRNT